MMSNPGLLPIKKKAAKSLFRRVSDWLHLWLGLSSGLVIFIVSMTGCLYVFEKDIREFTEPWQHVEEQPRPYLLPTPAPVPPA